MREAQEEFVQKLSEANTETWEKFLGNSYLGKFLSKYAYRNFYRYYWRNNRSNSLRSLEEFQGPFLAEWLESAAKKYWRCLGSIHGRSRIFPSENVIPRRSSSRRKRLRTKVNVQSVYRAKAYGHLILSKTRIFW